MCMIVGTASWMVASTYIVPSQPIKTKNPKPNLIRYFLQQQSECVTLHCIATSFPIFPLQLSNNKVNIQKQLVQSLEES